MDPATMAAASQLGGMGSLGIDSGGGSLGDSSSASNQGGTNAVGDASFGNYNPAASTAAWVPLVAVAAVALGGVLLLKKG